MVALWVFAAAGGAGGRERRRRGGWGGGGRGRGFGVWFLCLGACLVDGVERAWLGGREMVPWSLGAVEDVRRGMRVEREGRRRRVVQNMAR